MIYSLSSKHMWVLDAYKWHEVFDFSSPFSQLFASVTFEVIEESKVCLNYSLLISCNNWIKSCSVWEHAESEDSAVVVFSSIGLGSLDITDLFLADIA